MFGLLVSTNSGKTWHIFELSEDRNTLEEIIKKDSFLSDAEKLIHHAIFGKKGDIQYKIVRIKEEDED